jgi:hypothetical protein
MEASFPPDHGKRKTNDKKTGGCNGEVALYIFFHPVGTTGNCI